MAGAADPNDLHRQANEAATHGDLAAAASLLEQVLELDPARAVAQVTLGMIRLRLGQAAVARDLLEIAAQRAPGEAQSHLWLGHARMQTGDVPGAVTSLQRALAIQPNLIGRMSLEFFRPLTECDWRAWPAMQAVVEASAASGGPVVCEPTTVMLLSDSPASHLAAARSFATLFPAAPPLRAAPAPAGEKIRLAFLSSDFHDTPVAHLIAGVFEAIDKDAFHLTALNYGPRSAAPIRRRIEASFDEMLDVGPNVDPAAAAGLLAECAIDIAVGMNGHTRILQSQILRHRPAPVAVSFQGYPGTLGLDFVDYLIADRHTVPSGAEAFYAEQIVRMPHTYQPTDDKAPIDAATPSRADEGLPSDAFVFMGYNSPHKLSPATFDVWMRTLARTPGSVLWLQGRADSLRANLRREAEARGVDPARLVFAGRLDARPAHIARHRLADLFLDTLPYNAHSTASDALWAGLPVISCPGESFPARVCAGLLREAGLAELIAPDIQAYQDLAVALATDPDRLAAIRARVETQAPTCPLFDTAGYARALENAFRHMIQRSRAGLPPQAFDLA